MKFLTIFAITSIIFAQEIEYTVKFSNLSHHEITITAEFKDIKTNDLEIVYSRTSPGRYALHEFVKNVYNVTFTDKKGKKLDVTRPNLHEWHIKNHSGYVKMNYTLFGDRADGTYSGIDETHVHLNIPASFAWARGFDKNEITINFPDITKRKWKVASQIQTTNSPTQFKAKNLYYFLDSPIEISAHDIRSFKVKNQTVKLAVHHNVDEHYVDEYAKMAEAVVLEQEAVYGELAPYDHGEYVFLACYLPHVDGDGMEHRNSTILTSTAPLSKPMWVLGTLSHEFFHSWNVERIRPKSLEPFNFEDANVSGELWFAEGFTSYFDGLFIKRAGLTSEDAFVSQMNYPLNMWLNGPAVDFYSPEDMSKQAPFVDAAKSVDPQNKINTFFSYYTYGNAIGLVLDMEIRTRFPGKDLDGFMKLVWTRFGKPEKPYTNTDLMNTLSDYTGDKSYSEKFFNDYIFGKNRPNIKPLLAKFGYELQSKNPDQATLGNVSYKETEDGLMVNSQVQIGCTLYDAGIDQGDVIKSINKKEIKTKADLNSILNEAKINQKISIEFRQRGLNKNVTVKLLEDPTIEIVRYESINKTVTPEMLNLRSSWLDAKSPNSNMLIEKECKTCKRPFPYYYNHCYVHGDSLAPKIK